MKNRTPGSGTLVLDQAALEHELKLLAEAARGGGLSLGPQSKGRGDC
jgi:hypothetical protein